MDDDEEGGFGFKGESWVFPFLVRMIPQLLFDCMEWNGVELHEFLMTIECYWENHFSGGWYG
jgi:hypothetical protein